VLNSCTFIAFHIILIAKSLLLFTPLSVNDEGKTKSETLQQRPGFSLTGHTEHIHEKSVEFFDSFNFQKIDMKNFNICTKKEVK
jgi:hypothetical protein